MANLFPSFDVLVSTARPDVAFWKYAIDEMVRWKSRPHKFESADEPTEVVLDSAIDFAVDQKEEGGPLPTSIIPAGGGRIAMEWNDGRYTVVVEFTGLGTAFYTRFNGGKIERTSSLTWAPVSRKSQFRGWSTVR